MHAFQARFARHWVSKYAGALLLACSLIPAIAVCAGELSPLTVGEQTTPTFTLKALDGSTHRLADYGGKVLLVNFWASWCPPCLAELPGIQRLADRMAGEAFKVLLVNVGESPFRVSKFMKLTGVHLTSLLDDKGDVFKAWAGTVYPTSFVVDSAGQARYVAYGPLDWDNEVIVETLMGLLPLREAAAK
jgi:thiol-disulfide isomerase/thioredoxin